MALGRGSEGRQWHVPPSGRAGATSLPSPVKEVRVRRAVNSRQWTLLTFPSLGGMEGGRRGGAEPPAHSAGPQGASLPPPCWAKGMCEVRRVQMQRLTHQSRPPHPPSPLFSPRWGKRVVTHHTPRPAAGPQRREEGMGMTDERRMHHCSLHPHSTFLCGG